MQTTNTVLMVRPAAFMGNPETQASNTFQKRLVDIGDVQSKAQLAFDNYVQALRNVDIDVHIIDDIAEHDTPDSLFPNNWIAMLEDGTLYTFPMEAPNRRRERREDIIIQLDTDFVVNKRIDLSPHELEGRYLEGTGSLILDHDNYIAYSCRSSRSSNQVGKEFERLSGYRIVWFDAHDLNMQPIYHTNVMLSIGRRFAIVCLSALPSLHERGQLVESLKSTGKTIIDVSFEQMGSFTCNILELKDKVGNPVYAMSTRAWEAFTSAQQIEISSYARLALGPIDIIEDLGGGGARCMLCEVFLEKRMAYC
ncbi:arginine deiminase-related protein [Rouxiella sp. T17]|uniref:citrulline utilization hydrolase CtlX n=1 Tax=Rouxiella sp. T17 TaxID=3085684 RepID=UPI002FC5DA4E